MSATEDVFISDVLIYIYSHYLTPLSKCGVRQVLHHGKCSVTLKHIVCFAFMLQKLP